MSDEPHWLKIAREMSAMAQTGLTFTKDPFDRQRYERLRELSALMLAQGSEEDYAAILDSLNREYGYATPKVDVRGAAFRDGKILMVREISDGLWTLPGGWADINQSAGACVVREINEESGFIARALKLAAVFDYQKRNRPHSKDSIYKMFFICELTGGEARPSNETSEVAFFGRDALPPLSLGRSTAAQIERMFEHRADMSLATDFD
ncbi:MAG TPA: NUDIX hydrolase [Steroidobacteraceae bacterium]|jgi:ADP-ribose pyrophosphatase YjhB (NUDIX family)